MHSNRQRQSNQRLAAAIGTLSEKMVLSRTLKGSSAKRSAKIFEGAR